MTNEIKHENASGHGRYEREDLQASSILYFLLAIVVGAAISLVGLKGLFVVLDHHEKLSQPPVNPLVTNVPTDTLHVPAGYPQSVFPNPRLEEDERGQLNGIILDQDRTLYSYGWADEKAGVVRIPIKRAMELIAQRGLPVLPQGASGNAATPPSKVGISKKVEKKKK